MRRLLAGSFAAVAALCCSACSPARRARRCLDCNEPTALCAEPVDSIGYGGEYTGHDEPSLLFYSNTAGLGELEPLQPELPTDPKVLPNQAGTGGDVELPAAPGVLARDGAVRQPVRAGVHARPVHARQRHEHLRRDQPGGARLHRQAPGHGVPRGAVLPARLGSLAAGRQLRRDQVVRRDGDLQPASRIRTRAAEQRRLPRQRRATSRRTSPSSRRAACRTRRRPAAADGRRRSRRTRRPTCSWARATSSRSTSTTARPG